MDLYYKKNKNNILFNKIKDSEYLDLEYIQNYVPIYSEFFNLNETNYNSINLNSHHKLSNINQKIDYSKFNGEIEDNENNIIQKKIFFKYSPIFDPIKYMTGKYDTSYNIFKFPKLSDNTNIHEKIINYNNSAYIDGFFSFLSSNILNKHNFFNGIDYYGSYLAIKNNFNFAIEDDIEYLDDSDFFHSNLNNLFHLEENVGFKNIFNNTKKNKKSIIIENKNDNDIDLLIDNITNINLDVNISESNSSNLELEYNTDINIAENNDTKNLITSNNNKKTNNLCNSESCSSRYSDTESNNSSSKSNKSDSKSLSSTSSSSSNEEELLINIKKFPVNIISLECCDDTLDSYIIQSKIKDAEWESIILQILFALILYQEKFDMTHNDLHTNNIVYVQTDKKFLYYKYQNRHYKVPTFGKIYKIIDFGRAIYKYNGKIFCSDSYAHDGDANSQYNCEPYFNPEKPRIEPNYSFDLCRLGCSLFDYFIDDLDDIKKLKSPIKKIIVEWIFDDNNKNILYKNNGEERYPDFKLYKMIARTVHNHIPSKVLKKDVFDKYLISKKKINTNAIITNIDNIPCLINNINVVTNNTMQIC